VHTPLGDHLPVKLGQLLQEPDILQQQGTAFSRGHDILVVNDWSSGIGGQLLFF